MSLPTESKLRLLDHAQERYESLDSIFDLMIRAGLDPNSAIHEEVWRTFDDYLNLLAKEIGDGYEWLQWHCYDNKWGKKKLAITIDGKKHIITNNKKFLKYAIER